MLKGLDDVQWPAFDYPRKLSTHIRDLLSDDPPTRIRSINSLEHALFYHHGIISGNALPAIPYLIELLNIDSVEDKHAILRLLRILAHAQPNDANQAIDILSLVKEAVYAIGSIYRSLLDHDHPLVRGLALNLLLDCLHDEDSKIQLLRRFIEKETVPELTTKAVSQFATLLRASPQLRLGGSRWLLYFGDFLKNRISPCLKIAAISVMIEIYGDGAPDRLLVELRSQIRICQELTDEDFFGRLEYILENLSLSKRVDVLVQMFNEASDWGSYRDEFLHLLLRETFELESHLTTLRQITPEQLKALVTLARNFDFWSGDGTAYEPYKLERFGIPSKWRELLKFIETGGLKTMTDTPSKFKDYYGLELAELLANKIREHHRFPSRDFVAIVVARVGPLELKDRIKVFAEEIKAVLPTDYPTALPILLKVLGDTRPDESGMFNQGFWVGPIAQFVEDYGLDHPEISLDALPEITKRYTSEFAIRPYLMRHPEMTLARLQQWVTDPDAHVRRMVSEGTRTRLPWGPRLPQFINDPSPVLALLEQLKDDPSLYVRKSVANNLNDLTKDHPDLIIGVLARWNEGASDDRRWIIRHALRTLIKQGHPAALAILGITDSATIQVPRFEISPATIRLNESVKMTATLENQGDEPVDIVMDYVVHHIKKNGKASPKVFKWATRTLASNQSVTLQKSHAVKPITTRVYYPGRHVVELQVNGRVLASGEFELMIE